MANLVLSAATTAAQLLPQASTATRFFAQSAAQAASAFVAGRVNQLLFGRSRNRVGVGPRLDDLQLQASSEGAPIMRVFGRARIAGQLIWAADFAESFAADETSGGGKGGGSRRRDGGTYLYSVSFAVGLAEGPIDRVGRIWADGKLMSFTDDIVRIYKGAEDQQPDSAIEAVEGAGAAPAFRGTAYVVFEDLALARFGNRIPQLQFEVFRSLRDDDPGALENVASAVTVIPSAGEFVYATEEVNSVPGEGRAQTQNAHTVMGVTDFVASIDALEDLAPNCGAVALVVSWFGDDLRADQLALRPGVEVADKTTEPVSWSVNGVARAGAHVVSEIDGRPAFGGTPSDASVVAAVKDLKQRGLAVMFYPFILMDVPAGNALIDPYTGATGQPLYPWRGRITVTPAPGQLGTVDKTAGAATQINALVGVANPGDFAVSGETVSYVGPAEWSYRRMILHYAHLCAAAGGVDAFLIGSEMRGLTTVRATANAFPFVAALKQLAADVRGILGPSTKVSYAADWSEYFGHQPTDGTGDVFFHLDDLWADADIDFIGIDYYMPLADWRDGAAHLDAAAGAPSVYDLDYLKGNVRAGEGYDFFYASGADRLAQTRTPITDGAHAKDWVFRYKDLWNWWSNAHVNRPGGVEVGGPTAWTPESKPLWLTEVGCPAVDKGANQPNLFFDPKSSESAFPHFSDGERDDFMQRRYLEAVYQFWGEGPANNPISSVYAAPMVATDRIFAYTWDARPFPEFPALSDVWGDAPNWEKGHWLTGRLGTPPLAALVRELAGQVEFTAVDVSGLNGLVPGYVVERPLSPRETIEPLMQVFQFDAVESGAAVKFQMRGRSAVATMSRDDLAADEAADFELVRAQETNLPLAAEFGFIDAAGDYRHAVSQARMLTVRSHQRAAVEAPVVMETGEAQGIVDSLLADAWIMRDGASFALPPSRLALEPGDVATVIAGGRAAEYRLGAIEDAGARGIEATRTEQSVYDKRRAPSRRTVGGGPTPIGAAVGVFLDLPIYDGAEERAHAPVFAAFAEPWPGAVAVRRGAGGDLSPAGSALAPAVMGELTAPLAAGPVAAWDRAAAVSVRLYGGALQSRTERDVLNGANLAAIEAPSGAWEILQFRDAILFGDGTYTLSTLLRGQAGGEDAAAEIKPAGARFVLLSDAVRRLETDPASRGLEFDWAFGPATRDPSDATWRTVTAAFAGEGLRPYSPVHPKAARIGGDIHISWIRRTRIGGDSWENADAPLGEEAEVYEVDILDNGAVVRTLTAGEPRVVYAAADQIVDFGGPGVGSTLEARLYQLSASYGRGSARAAQFAF